jgi:hypothetical protein
LAVFLTASVVTALLDHNTRLQTHYICIVLQRSIPLIHLNGSRSFFDKKGTSYEARPPETGTLVYQSDRRSYHARNNRSLDFDSNGRLIALIKSGSTLSITYLDNIATVTDGFGNTLKFTGRTGSLAALSGCGRPDKPETVRPQR